MKFFVAGLVAVAGLLAAFGQTARAEVFVLVNGGRVEGEWLNRDEPKRQNYVVRLSSGGKLTLDNAQVKQVVEARPDELEYEKIRPQYPDTAEGQWKLAQWCLEHQLLAQRKTHLQRVIELSPDNVEARRALGYSKFDGEWMTQEEKMTKDGYIKYHGAWKTKQEIELIESKHKQDLAEKDWYQKIKRWRGWLGGGKDELARANITGISDPAAVKALATELHIDTEAPIRLLYIEGLTKIGTPEAADSLALDSIEDPVEEVRLTCLDHLVDMKNPKIIAGYVTYLRSKDNRYVNRAAVALGRMKDPSTIGPLIDALTTMHKFKVTTGDPGSMTTTFNKGPSGSGAGGGMGGMGFGAGGGGPKIMTVPMSNQSVLDALVTLTGQNFAYDARRWHTWYNAQKKSEVAGSGSRRD
jgi:hypothetical protein